MCVFVLWLKCDTETEARADPPQDEGRVLRSEREERV